MKTTTAAAGKIQPRGLVLLATALITPASLYVMSTNGPGEAQIQAAWTVMGALVFTLALQRYGSVAATFAGAGGACAIAFTDREFFSFWPAGSALVLASLVLEPRLEGRTFPRIATTAGALGLLLAAYNSGGDVSPALVPVGVAMFAAVAIRALDRGIARTRQLRAHAAEMQARVEASEELNRELARRTSLARDLHDSLGHHVTAMVVQAEAGQVGRPLDALEAIADLGREALDELEVVLFGLRNTTSTGRIEDIEPRLLSRLRSVGIETQWTATATDVDAERGAVIYRIVQEAVTNVLRHAQATTASVEIRDDGGDLVVLVEDDGIGFTQNAPASRNGLRGMAERAGQLGGVVEISSSSGRGTIVHARIPRGGA